MEAQTEVTQGLSVYVAPGCCPWGISGRTLKLWSQASQDLHGSFPHPISSTPQQSQTDTDELEGSRLLFGVHRSSHLPTRREGRCPGWGAGRARPPGCGGPGRDRLFIPSGEAAGAWERGSAPLANQKQGMEPHLLPALRVGEVTHRGRLWSTD